jgi:hypothetical protein
MRSTAVRLLALSALFGAAACDGDGAGSSRLTTQEVAGVYRVCTLRFVPQNTAFPGANLLERVIDTTPPPGKLEPTVTLFADRPEYQFAYTRSDAASQDFRSGLSFTGGDQVLLRFYTDQDNRGQVPAELLLPSDVRLDFQDNPRRLSTSASRTYSVARRDYARAAGVDESGFAATIPGSLDISLRVGSCT